VGVPGSVHLSGTISACFSSSLEGKTPKTITLTNGHGSVTVYDKYTYTMQINESPDEKGILQGTLKLDGDTSVQFQVYIFPDGKMLQRTQYYLGPLNAAYTCTFTNERQMVTNGTSMPSTQPH
jgi:hypothetical protein